MTGGGTAREDVLVRFVTHPHSVRTARQRPDDAVSAADALCEREQLLVLASPPEVRRLQQCMRGEIVAQVRGVRTPLPWDALVRAGHDGSAGG